MHKMHLEMHQFLKNWKAVKEGKNHFKTIIRGVFKYGKLISGLEIDCGGGPRGGSTVGAWGGIGAFFQSLINLAENWYLEGLWGC